MSSTTAGGLLANKKVLVSAVAGVVLATTALGGLADKADGSDQTVVATFTDASPLLVGNDVRTAGVKVGTITGMRIVAGRAEVTMKVSPAALPLHRDARATIRPVSLLGERYVELQRGSATAPVFSGEARLPLSQTASSTDLDQVLNTVDDPTGKSLAALITMLGEGADGNGKNIAATLKALEPALTRTGELADVLNEQNGVLQSTLDNLKPVATSLATDNGRALDGLTSSAERLLGAASANRMALEQTLAELPSTLATARATLASLAGTAQAATPTLESLRPVTDNLQQLSQELLDFADSADPALASATPVLKKVRFLLDQAAPVVQALNAAGPAAVSAAKSLRPLVGDLTNNITNVLNAVKFWALTTNGYDGLSHYFRAMLVVSPAAGTGLAPVANLGNLGVGGQPSVAPSPGHKPALGVPALPGVTDALNGVVSGLLSPKQTKDGGVTGMTQQQEQGGLLSLLGLGGN